MKSELSGRDALRGFLGLMAAMQEGHKPGSKAHQDRAVEIALALADPGCDWVVTIPAKTDFGQYLLEVEAARARGEVLNYRVRSSKAKVGDRLWVTWRGQLRGWMMISAVIKSNGFTCTSTGAKWPPGTYVQRSGQFNPCEPQPLPGFRGIRKLKPYVSP